MTTYPEDRTYSAEHEWIAVDGETATVGITQFAADALGEAVFVELPEVGAQVRAGEACGEIESTKSVSDLIAPASGQVTEVNEAAVEAPETITFRPQGDGWLYRLRVTELPESLMSASDYAALAAEQEA